LSYLTLSCPASYAARIRSLTDHTDTSWKSNESILRSSSVSNERCFFASCSASSSNVSVLVVIVFSLVVDVDLSPVLHIDAEVKVSDITERLVSQQVFFEPSGTGNPQPLFVWRDAPILSKQQVGQDDKHLKLKFESGHHSGLDAIGFGLGDRYANLGNKADLVFTLEFNEWNGQRNEQLNVKDIQ